MNYKFGDLSLLISNKQVETNAKVIETEFKFKTKSDDVKSKSNKNKRTLNDSEKNIENNDETPIKHKKKKHKNFETKQNTEETSIEDNNIETTSKKIKKQKKNKKLAQSENETDDTNVESVENKIESVSVENELKEAKKIDPEKQAAINNRTIFVGNWPLKKEKKHLKKYFKQYGTIETVRFRSVPVGDIRIPKKVTAITKQFHPDRTSTNAYVQFADETSAKRALAANGSCYEEHHLRVTLANSNGDHDPKKTIFLGNVHFQAEEDDLWQIFSDCGEIESVKIIRDQKTGLGKGMGFVNFKSADGVELALKMDEVSIKDRPLRIKRVQHKQIKKVKKEKKKLSGKNGGNAHKQPISNSEAYEMRVGKKKIKPYQGVKYTPKLKNKLKKKPPVKRLQKKKKPIMK